MTLNSADSAFAARLSPLLPEGVLRTVAPRYLEEPRGRFCGQAGVLALPRDVAQVAVLLRAANAARVPVVPYGGGTGLVCGQVMPKGPLPLVISLEAMNAIRAVYAEENLLVAEAGAILADVQAAALAADRLFPLSLASEGSARIGGNLATNAGGVNMLRYGNARDLCLGRSQLGEGISAFELIHRQGLEFLSAALPQLRQPFASAPEWCVLVELGLAQGQDPEQALSDLFELGLGAGVALDGVIAQSETQRNALWAVREQIPEANRYIGAVSSHDISVPLSVIPDFITRGGEVIAALGDFRINCFGHLGDGNLHYNVFPAAGRHRAEYDQQRDAVKRAVHDLVHEMGGSISAEHGIGRLKVADLERYGDPVKLATMRAIKQALDPNGIMNPGVVLQT